MPPGAMPPAAAPPPGYAAPYGAAPGGAPNIGTAFSWAFAMFGKYWIAFVGLAAIVVAIRIVQYIATTPITNAFLNCDPNQAVVIGENGAVVVNNLDGCVASFGTTIIVGIVMAVIFGVLAWLVTIGVYRAALKTSNGETPGFHNITSAENLGSYILVSILYALMVGIGLVLCILPGIVAIFLFQLAPFYALDKGEGISAFGSSLRAITKNLGPAILMTLINLVAAFVGSFFFGLLVLVALPFSALFTVHLYRQFNGEPISNPA
jgi:uncharacterized membrane protein